MDFVSSVGIPDDELAVLRRGNEVSAVCRPVHGVDLGQVTLQGPLGLHRQPRQLLNTLAGDIANCRVGQRQLVAEAIGARRARVRVGTYEWCRQARPSSALSGP